MNRQPETLGKSFMLRSPRSQTVLKPVFFGCVEVDVDLETGGVWLDGDELNQLTDWFQGGL